MCADSWKINMFFRKHQSRARMELSRDPTRITRVIIQAQCKLLTNVTVVRLIWPYIINLNLNTFLFLVTVTSLKNTGQRALLVYTLLELSDGDPSVSNKLPPDRFYSYDLKFRIMTSVDGMHIFLLQWKSNVFSWFGSLPPKKLAKL